MISYKKSHYNNLIYLLPLLCSSITCMELITITEPTYIKNLKRKRDTFIKGLTTKYNAVFGTIYDPIATYFYPIYNAGPRENICERVTKNNSPRLPLLKAIRMERHSALGMVIMANKIPATKKRKALDKLIPLGFTPTPQDRKAAFLDWWERAQLYKIILLQYAIQEKSNAIPEFPHDLIKFIASIMIKLEKPLLSTKIHNAKKI